MKQNTKDLLLSFLGICQLKNEAFSDSKHVGICMPGVLWVKGLKPVGVGVRHLFLPFIPLIFIMTKGQRKIIATGWVPGQGTSVAYRRPLVRARIQVKVLSEMAVCWNSGGGESQLMERPGSGVKHLPGHSAESSRGSWYQVNRWHWILLLLPQPAQRQVTISSASRGPPPPALTLLWIRITWGAWETCSFLACSWGTGKLSKQLKWF